MLNTGNRFALALAASLVAAPAARAQFAVIDVASLTQLVTEVQTLDEQLTTAREHLAQAQAEFRSMSGGRGMEQLLSGTVRNYLPPDWPGVQRAAQGTGAYPTLSQDVRTALAANAILSGQQLAALSPPASLQVQEGRGSIAILQALAHEALASTSGRFAALQQLIAAIPRAADQKAVLDLQARIAAEQGMLANEQTKLEQLYVSVQAERWAAEQRSRERSVAGQGQFAARFQPKP